MSTSTKTTPAVTPALIVFGTPAGAKAPQAAWFRASYAERAKSAAQRQALTTIAVNSNDTRAAAQTLKEGQLKVGGRLEMPSVSQEVINRLQTLHASAAVNTGEPSATTAAGVQMPRSVWDSLKPTDLVLAADLDKSGEPDGWYEATVMKVENGVYTIRWLYAPEVGFVRLQRQHIAIMFPG